jgi:antigen flippase
MELVRAGLLLGGATAVRMAANLAIVKVIALHLGAGGMGYLGQFMSVVALTTALAGGGVAMGLTRSIAAEEARGSSPVPHVRAAIVIWLVSGAAFALLVGASARSLSGLLFGTPDHAGVFWAVAIGQFVIGAANLLGAVLNGKHDVAGLAAVNTLGAVAGAAITSLLVMTAGLDGAMWGLILAPCTSVLFAGVRVWRKRHLRGSWRGHRPHASHYRDLLAFSAMLLVTVCAMPLTQIVLRWWQEAALGWDQVGIWQGLVKLSDAWLQLASVLLAHHYFARLSRSAGHGTLHREVRTTFLACAAALVPAATCIWLLREPLIALVFSPTFLRMQDLLGAQLAGDVLRTLAYVVGYVAMAQGRTGLYILAELYQAGALLLLAHFFIPRFGAHGVPYAYCLTYMSYLLICVAAYGRYHARQTRAAA